MRSEALASAHRLLGCRGAIKIAFQTSASTGRDKQRRARRQPHLDLTRMLAILFAEFEQVCQTMLTGVTCFQMNTCRYFERLSSTHVPHLTVKGKATAVP